MTIRARMTIGSIVALLALALFPASAHEPAVFKFGHPGKAEQVTREVRVTALDIKFTPTEIAVRAGETIRFIVTNDGKLPHEFVLGDAASQAAHEREMQAMSDMKMHDDPNGISLKPGQTRELIWTFTRTEKIQYGCHIPGHFTAGMVGEVVAAANAPADPAGVVDAFFAALQAGDLAKARAFLDPKVQIFESGYVERSAEEYAAHHMLEDAEFLKTATQTITARSGETSGDLAWVASEQRTKAVSHDKPVDVLGTETMVLHRTAAGWRIVHIHWSSHRSKNE